MKNSIYNYFLLILLFISLFSKIQAQETWILCNPLPTAEDLNDIAYGNGVYVAVGTRGTILTSSDGIIWTNQTSGMLYDFYSVTWINNQFIATGDLGTIIFSPDGVNWSKSNTGTTWPCRNVVWANNQYFSFFSGVLGGAVYSSTDGISWNKTYSLLLFRDSDRMFFGNNLFIISNGDGLFTSSDGTEWIVSSKPVNIKNIVWNGNLFISESRNAKDILTSDDGINWTIQATDTFGCSAILVQNDKLVALRFNGSIVCMFTSSDGLTWVKESVPLTFSITFPPNIVIWSNKQFIAVGKNGQVMTSPDGRSWSLRSSGLTKSFSSVTWGNDKFVAVGSAGYADTLLTKSAIATSTDGIIWSLTNRTAARLESLEDIIWASQQFVAIGSYGLILTSPDGISWAEHNQDSTLHFKAVAWNGNLLVAVTSNSIGNIYSSSDGNNWSKQYIDSTNYFSDIIWGNNLFVAVGSMGIVTSPNGVSWTNRLSGSNVYCNVIACNGSQFVAGTNKGVYYTSTNGIDWSKRQLTDTTIRFSSISYLNNQFYAVIMSYFYTNQYSLNPDQKIYRTSIINSFDAVNWSLPFYNFSQLIGQITFGNDKFVAIGQRSVIMTSIPGARAVFPRYFRVKVTNCTFSNGVVNYNLQNSSYISLNLYDLKGRLVKKLVNSNQKNGSYKIALRLKNLNGIYILLLEVDGTLLDKSLVFLK